MTWGTSEEAERVVAEAGALRLRARWWSEAEEGSPDAVLVGRLPLL